MRFDLLKVLSFMIVIVGLGLEVICILGLIKEGIIPGNSRLIAGWTVGVIAFIPINIIFIRIFLSINDD